LYTTGTVIMENNSEDPTILENMVIKERKKQLKSDAIPSINIEPENTVENVQPMMHPDRINEKIADMLGRLSSIMQKKGDAIRSRIYARAQDTVLGTIEDIMTPDDLKGKPNIGPTILSKINEFLETGTLDLFEREKNNPANIFTDVYGIGPKKAMDIVANGITTIDELRKQQESVLNSVQKIGLKYYEDILERIPRSEIERYDSQFKSVFRKVSTKGAKYEIVGSYRRGCETSGDIDVIITSPEPTIMSTFVEELKKRGVILEILSQGNIKTLVIAKLPNEPRARRVDFMYTPLEEYPFATLYFTGSKVFNTVMRGYALKLGISLNEHGMYKKEQNKVKGNKIEGVFESERDIFKSLFLKYKKPTERTSGIAVETTIPIVDRSNVEVAPISCYRSCELVPNGKCATGCRPSWNSNKLIGSTNWCKCNLDKTPCEFSICNKTKKVREKKESTRKNSKTDKSPITETHIKPKKRKYTRKQKVDPPIIEDKNSISTKPDEPFVDLVPILKVDKPKRKYTRKVRVDKNKEKTDLDTTVDTRVEMPKKKTGEDEKAFANIQSFKTNGMSVIEKLTETELANMVELANHMYYNTDTSMLTDNEFDIIKEHMERSFPTNAVLKKIGAKVIKNKIVLPYNMPSMDKIKPDTTALATWMREYSGPYVLSCKLDGVSGMYSTECDEPKLYTRGDGTIGQDISHFIDVLNLPKEKGLVIRGEFIIPKHVFETKYRSQFANARNLVAGIINSKTIGTKAKDMHFVAYEVIRPETKPSDQMEKMASWNYETVLNESTETLTNEMLSEKLLDWRSNYEYEIDGVIVANDALYQRTTANPKHAFAFKMVISDQVAEVRVVDVLWNASKSGYLKPRVRIEPIRLGGVTIEYATGFNANFIESNKIGIGATVQIVRSGDVIPHIKSVSIPAEIPKMPTVPYHWTDSHVDIILDNVDGDTGVQEKNITAFFSAAGNGLGVDGLSSGNVRRIMDAGYTTVPAIIQMKRADFEKVDGFKEKMISKIHDGIQEKLETASLIDIMAASNQFGRGIGKRKIEPIMRAHPNILTDNASIDVRVQQLLTVPGIGRENATSFAANIPKFTEFISAIGQESKLSNNKITTEAEPTDEAIKQHYLYGKHIVMTKVRDKSIEDHLKKMGGTLDDVIGKKTNILIVKNTMDVSNKTKYAKDNNIPIITPEEYRQLYMN